MAVDAIPGCVFTQIILIALVQLLCTIGVDRNRDIYMYVRLCCARKPNISGLGMRMITVTHRTQAYVAARLQPTSTELNPQALRSPFQSYESNPRSSAKHLLTMAARVTFLATAVQASFDYAVENLEDLHESICWDPWRGPQTVPDRVADDLGELERRGLKSRLRVAKLPRMGMHGMVKGVQETACWYQERCADGLPSWRKDPKAWCELDCGCWGPTSDGVGTS